MENINDVEANKLLTEAGIEDVGDMSMKEQLDLVRILKESRQDGFGASSVSNSQEDSGKLSQEDSGKLSQEEKDTVYLSLKAGKALVNKNFDSNSQKLANINLSVGEKDVIKQSPPRKDSNYSSTVEGSPSASSGPHRLSPGGAVQMKHIDLDSYSSYQGDASSPNDNVWLEAKGKRTENGTLSKRLGQSVNAETKPESPVTAVTEEAGNSVGKDNNNTACDESNDRQSPNTVEVVPLMPLVFVDRHTTSYFSERALPSLSLPEEEWLDKINKYLFARKAAKIEAEARRSRWVILSARSINIMSLESAVEKSSPQHAKDDSVYNFPESIENSPKARTSPENIVDNVPEGSADFVSMENSPPKEDPVNSESRDNAALDLPDCSKKQGKIETPLNSPAGRSDVNGGGDTETNRRKSSRNRNKKGRGNNRLNCSNDDNSNGAQSSSTMGKNCDRDYPSNNTEFPPIGGNSPTDNNVQAKVLCPICGGSFDASVIQGHAWECGRSTAEEENQVAENGGGSDANEFKQRKSFSMECGDEDLHAVEKPISVFSKKSDEDNDFVEKPLPKIRRKLLYDDDDFASKEAASESRKRNLVISDDEDTASKTSRK